MPVALGGTESSPFDVVGVGVNTVDLVAVVDDYPAPDSKRRLRLYAELPGAPVTSDDSAATNAVVRRAPRSSATAWICRRAIRPRRPCPSRSSWLTTRVDAPCCGAGSRRPVDVRDRLRSTAPIVVVAVTLLLVGGSAGAQRAPQVGPDLSPAEVQQLFDAFVLVQAQEALSLTDAQFAPFVSSLKRLQEVRRRNQQQEQR